MACKLNRRNMYCVSGGHGRRTDVGIDLYNLFNENFATAYQQMSEQRTTARSG